MDQMSQLDHLDEKLASSLPGSHSKSSGPD